MAEDKGDMTVAEAGRKGGAAVKAKYGTDHYSKIGTMGGAAVAKKGGPEFYSRIGRLGGEANKAAHGIEHYTEIGRMGGEALKAQRGSDYYSAIGKKGGAANAANLRKRPRGRNAESRSSMVAAGMSFCTATNADGFTCGNPASKASHRTGRPLCTQHAEEEEVQELRRTAGHEAAHWVVGYVLGEGVGAVSIVQEGNSQGRSELHSHFTDYSQISPSLPSAEKQHIWHRVVCSLAGDAYEQILGYGLRSGLSSDMDGAARHLLAVLENPGRDSEVWRPCYDHAFHQAGELIHLYWRVVEALADALMKQRTLNREEAHRVVETAIRQERRETL